MGYLFTSESVSEGHPDKVADQISDAVLDELLAFDKDSKVACETMVTTGQVILAGEVKSSAYVDLQEIARRTIKRIGYTKAEYKFESESCGVLSAIHEQSADINRGVEREDPMNQGAGDQGMMFGYATNETENYMPLSLDLAHKLLMVLAEIRREGKVMTYLRPDAKSQVTIEYDDNGTPVRIDTIVVSTQHDDFIQPEDDSQAAQLKADEEMLSIIRRDVIEILMPRVIASIHHDKVLALFNDKIIYHVNPTGKFVIGGPHGDTGLTGRKIIVDTYGGKGAHGGGAFSGKDPSKVDRSAAYAARYVAKNIVAAGLADRCEIQVSYAIGVAEPTSIMVETFGTEKVPSEQLTLLVRDLLTTPLLKAYRDAENMESFQSLDILTEDRNQLRLLFYRRNGKYYVRYLFDNSIAGKHLQFFAGYAKSLLYEIPALNMEKIEHDLAAAESGTK